MHQKWKAETETRDKKNAFTIISLYKVSTAKRCKTQLRSAGYNVEEDVDTVVVADQPQAVEEQPNTVVVVKDTQSEETAFLILNTVIVYCISDPHSEILQKMLLSQSIRSNF